MQGCDNFKEIRLRNCPENFIITAGLDATTVYGVEFKNKFDRRFLTYQETDADGVLTVPVGNEEENLLTQDLFHSFSGAWELRLSTSLDEGQTWDPRSFCDGSEYLVLIFEDTDPLPDPNNAVITIECPEV